MSPQKSKAGILFIQVLDQIRMEIVDREGDKALAVARVQDGGR
jgi:hypothetical protein